MEIKDLSVSRLMTSDLITVSPETRIEDAGDTLIERDVGSLLVLDSDGELAGILTGTDFVGLVSSDVSAVEQCMTADVVTVGEDDSVRDAAAKMIANDVQHLPVVGSDDGVVGMISATDLTAHLSYLEA
jgi:CBS domain-containing protein